MEGLDSDEVLRWFVSEKTTSCTLLKVDSETSKSLAAVMGLAVRRCYISDEAVRKHAIENGLTQEEIIAAALPDPGPVMAGDFGELLTYAYQSAGLRDVENVGFVKWRLKQDRTKPAPYSDVVHLALPTWPTPSEKDSIVCSEVKTKSTDGVSKPISKAIADSAKDRTSRLARTLVWMRQRTITGSWAGASVAQLERFINASDYPVSSRSFRAVAVICSSLVDAELADVPSTTPSECDLIIISVAELKATYEAVMTGARLATC